MGNRVFCPENKTQPLFLKERKPVMKEFLKRRFVLVLSAVMLLAVLFAGNALAGGGITHEVSSPQHFSGTGWAGWSCPAGTVVVAGGYEPADHVVLVSEAAKEGSASGLYPNYPHYDYTPPEEGWVVQNGGVSATLTIWVDCAPAPEVLPEYICHATESPTNPFIVNSPSNIGQLMGHVGPGHQGGEDIIPPVPVFLPLGQNWDTVGQAIWENGCEVPVHELAFVHTKDCVGWSYGYVLDGVETIIASGEWVDPYGKPEKIFVSFEVFLPKGEIANRSPIFGPWYLVEPADCQIFRKYKAHQAYLKDNCEGIQRVINLYEGPASDPYATLVGTLYNETVPFVDPLVLETIPAVTVDVPAAYGSDHIFAAMDEPEFCYSTCALDVFSRSWTEEILTPEGAVQVTTFFEYVDSLDPEVVCRVTEEVEIVYESCLNAESTYEVPGEWTAWYVLNGPNKERSRIVEVFDSETDFKCGEYTKYDQECFADDFIWVWRGCGCSIRDRTYELYQFGSPPLNAQRAYCGCDFSCSFEGAWNDSGYVNNCQGADYTHWDELPKWCGFTSCE